jgi:hypothetical protein
MVDLPVVLFLRELVVSEPTSKIYVVFLYILPFALTGLEFGEWSTRYIDFAACNLTQPYRGAPNAFVLEELPKCFI